MRNVGRSRSNWLATVGIGLTALGALAIVGLVSRETRGSGPSAPRAPTESAFARTRTGGGRMVRRDDARSGCGWSREASTPVALGVAYRHARGERATPPDFVYVAFGAAHAPADVASALLDRGAHRILGESTDGGLLTPDGFLSPGTDVLGLVASDLEQSEVGLAGASFARTTIPDATTLAFVRALEDGGRLEDCALVLFRSTSAAEEVRAVLEGEVPEGVPVLGGRSGPALLVGTRVLEDGVGVAMFFADGRVAWCESEPAELTVALDSVRATVTDPPGGLVFLESTAASDAATLAGPLETSLAELPWLGVVGAGDGRSSVLLLPRGDRRRVSEAPALVAEGLAEGEEGPR